MKNAVFLLTTSFFERLSYYGMTASIVVFFTRDLGMDSVFAQQMQAVFQTIIYMIPIVGAFIADSWSGRYYLAIVSLGTSISGVLMLTIGAGQKLDWLALLGLFGFYGLPIALVKANILVLGGDQFNPKVPDQLKQRTKFFAAQYWITNVSSTIANLVLNQIAVEGMGAITLDRAFPFTFMISTICLIGAFAALMIGGKWLFQMNPKGSALATFFKVTGAALHKRQKIQGVMVLVGIMGLFFSVILSIITFFIDIPELSYTLAAINLICCFILIWYSRDGSWIENAEHAYPGRFSRQEILAASDVYRLGPYLALAIPFWAVYNQMNTAFIAQGCQMNNRIGDGTMAPSLMHTFNSAGIVVMIPIFDYGLYPLFRKLKWKGEKGFFTFTPLRKIGAGMFMGGIVMLTAALLEISRKASDVLTTECTVENQQQGWCSSDQIGTLIPDLSSCYQYTDNGERIPKREFSLWFQSLEYIFVGICEIFLALVYYEFFYSQVPPFMRSVCQAANLFTTSLGTMVGGMINQLCITWLPNNLDNGHQEYMFFINMGFCWVFFVIFVFVSRKFVYKPGTSGMPGDEAAVGEGWSVSDSHSKSKSKSKSKSSSTSSSEDYYYYSNEKGIDVVKGRDGEVEAVLLDGEEIIHID